MGAIERRVGALSPFARGPVAVIVQSPWDWARRTLNRQRRLRLCAYEGVIGCGLGARVRGGRPVSEPCATVYVTHKRALGDLPRQQRLPRRLGTQSRSLDVDVLELGELERHSGPLPLALDGAQALTRSREPSATPLSRPAVFPSDEGATVRLMGFVSGSHAGVLRHAYVCLPGWGLEHALLADVHSVPGDSDAPLLDAEGLLLGSLVGRATGGGGRLRVFRLAAPPLTPDTPL